MRKHEYENRRQRTAGMNKLKANINRVVKPVIMVGGAVVSKLMAKKLK